MLGIRQANSRSIMMMIGDHERILQNILEVVYGQENYEGRL